MNNKNNKIIHSLLTVVSCAGVIATFIIVSKETPKANEQLEKLPKKTKKSKKVKVFVKNYKYSLIFASITVGSIIGSTMFSIKQESNLLAAAAMIDMSYHKYKDTVKNTLGIDTDKYIKKTIMEDNYRDEYKEKNNANEKLYYIEQAGYFYANPEKLMEAYILMNRDLSGDLYFSGDDSSNGVVTIGEFLITAEARLLSHNITKEQLNYGWSTDYLQSRYRSLWVHIEACDPDENNCILLLFNEDPVCNPADWYDYINNLKSADEYFKDIPINKTKIKEGETK